MFTSGFQNGEKLFVESRLVGKGYLNFWGVEKSEKNITGEVISVYSRAVNILYKERYLLISIVKDVGQMSSLSILVPGLFRLRQGLINGFVGRDVTMSERLLDLGDVVVRIDRGEEWSGNARSVSWRYLKYRYVPVFLEKDFVEYLVNILVSVVPDKGFIPILTSIILGKWSKDVEKYIEYAIGYLERIGERIEKRLDSGIDLSGLVGLGIGFTPSGDDFITGCLLADLLIGDEIIDRNSIEKRLASTNYGGRTLLWQAVRDEFPYYFIKGVRELVGVVGGMENIKGIYKNDSREIIRVIIQKLISHGSTSGIDAFVGFLWYVYLLGLWKRSFK